MTIVNPTRPSQLLHSSPAIGRLLCAAALALSSFPAFAQEAVATETATPPAVQTAAAKPAASRPEATRSKADAAATATLAALLPRLAGSDTIPLMDRSAMFAGDLSRLLSAYDASKGVAAAADAALANDSDGKVQSILRRAMALIGTPYRWGGSSPDAGFDCSGLVGYVFRTALGIELPRVSREMASQTGNELIKDRAALVAGDLVFFGRKGRVDHVGIYVGEGRFLHAPSTGKDVRTDTLLSGYWGDKFMQARRMDL